MMWDPPYWIGVGAALVRLFWTVLKSDGTMWTTRLFWGMITHALIDWDGKDISFENQNGALQALVPSQLNMEDDKTWEFMCLYRQYYAWAGELMTEYSHGITNFKTVQKQVHAALAGQTETEKTLTTEHKILPRPPLLETDPAAFPLIQRVVSRRKQGAEVKDYYPAGIIRVEQGRQRPQMP
ncbi:hypothetical protein C8R43DRAFT_966113 [Mycena crocata]|nr:hypothetical protein C8R43DRAFT_966113 [Mycena crocata]